MTENLLHVDGEKLLVFCAVALERAGLSSEYAEVAADVIVRTTLRGVESHGVNMFPDYLDRIHTGVINPNAIVSTAVDAGAIAVLDGHGAMGQVTATLAVRTAVEKASASGCATVLVRNSNHLGACGTYAVMCAESNMLGFVYTNGPLVMRATGGRGPNLTSGTRAYGVPNQKFPIVLDVSMAVSGTKITAARDRGDEIPEGWLEDAEGRPVRDPNAYFAGGARVPIGEHKGFGMALVAEILAAALSGSSLAWDAPALPNFDEPIDASAVNRPWNLGHAVIALDVSAFMPLEDFFVRVQEVIDHVKRSRLAEGVDRILIPGERAQETEQTRRAHGIPLDPAVYDRLTSQAEMLACVPELKRALLG